MKATFEYFNTVITKGRVLFKFDLYGNRVIMEFHTIPVRGLIIN